MKKSLLVAFVAAVAAVVGVVISVVTLLKRSDRKLESEMNFEDEEFFGEDFEDADMITMDIETEEYIDMPEEDDAANWDSSDDAQAEEK